MKKLKFALVALMMVSITAFAQQKNQKQKVKKATPEQRAMRQTETLAAKLLLNPEQKEKVNSTILSKINVLDQIKTKYQGVKSKERNAELKAARISYEQDMKNILTPEQFEKWYKPRKERMNIQKNNNQKNPKVKTTKATEPEETEDIF